MYIEIKNRDYPFILYYAEYIDGEKNYDFVSDDEADEKDDEADDKSFVVEDRKSLVPGIYIDSHGDSLLIIIDKDLKMYRQESLDEMDGECFIRDLWELELGHIPLEQVMEIMEL